MGKLIAPRAWKTAKIRALFAMLISERGRVFPQAQLAEQLWPDSEDSLALVRRRISELRYILEPELKKASLSRYILRRSHGYCFTPKADCWVDTEEFARYEQEGREGERTGNWPAAIEAYKKASQLYQGDFLAGDEGDWVYLMRGHWRERYLYVMTRLAECYSHLGQHQEAIEVCRCALQVDPHYEEGYRRLMLSHYHRGERAQALQVYEDYRRRLADELDLSPSPRMEELRQQIIQGRVSVPTGPPPESDLVPYSLAQLPFVGRETESAQLQKYLQDAQAGQGRLVLISGEPGVGKTRLAQEVLRKSQRDGALVLWGRCREGAAESPYLPLAEALRDAISHFRYEDFAPIKPLWLAEIAALVPELRPLLPQLPQNPTLAPHQAQWRLFEAVAQLFSGLARSPRLAKPLVLWLDDLQWAAPTLLNLLDHLCHRLAESPICIIGAYRSTEVTANHPLYKKLITGCQQSHHLMLSRLPYAAIQQMLSQVGPKLPPEFCRFIYHESEGNPLFVTMLLQELFHRRIVTVAADGGWVCPKIDRLRPFTAQGITALFRQRLARLSPTEESVLHLAAVIGRDFDYELLRAAWGRRWFERGTLSLYFLNATTDREAVRAFIQEPPAGAADAQVEAWVLRDDGMQVAQGTASVGDPGVPTALQARPLERFEPGELRILAGVQKGHRFAPVEVRCDPAEQERRLAVTTEPMDWYRGEGSPWGAPPVLIAPLVQMLYAKSLAQVRGGFGAVGLFGAIEVRNVNGPALVGETYTCTGEVIAVGQSPKTEYLWFETGLDDAGGRRVAEMRMLLRFMKASSGLYPELQQG
ncbi:MAG: AAA family ATPase [Bryobacteraceae bacterium]|nr:AAA family ATPase [Bryobacteraceae bacterium]